MTNKLNSFGLIDRHQVFVIDQSDQDVKISQLVKGKIIDRIAVFNGERNETFFQGCGLVKWIQDCQMLKSEVCVLGNIGDGLGELWPGAKMEVFYSMVSVWILPLIRPVETILTAL